MYDKVRHDNSYEPPTKEFIRNSLLYGLLSENDDGISGPPSQRFDNGYTDLGLILKNMGKI